MYNLNEDIREKNNVADQYPDIVKEMELIMQNEHISSELFPLFLK